MTEFERIYLLLVGIGLLLSFLALLVTAIAARQSSKSKRDQYINNTLSDLIKIGFEYPNFGNRKYCLKLINEQSDDNPEWLKYNNYAILIWNWMETIYEIYGKSIMKTNFHGALKDISFLHQDWLYDNNRYESYDPELLEFIRFESGTQKSK